MKFPLPHDKILPGEIKLDRIPNDHNKGQSSDKVIGSLVGLAIGDALGASVEFRPREYLVAHPVFRMQGGGTWGLDVGKWTDDTSMALCLAASLIVKNSFNPYDQMVRYKWWNRYGWLSSTGNCFDIGRATREAINEFVNRQQVLKMHFRCRNEHEVDELSLESVNSIADFSLICTNNDSAGNGALMRLAPVPLFFSCSPHIAIECAGISAALTHPNKKAIDACRYYAALIVAAVNGYEKHKLLDKKFYEKHKVWFGEEPLDESILKIITGSYQKDRRKDGYEQGIRGKGYVVSALEAALWAFWSDDDSFEKGVLLAVNLGDDTDTTAAIYGQLAGAYYGYDAIKDGWKRKLYAHDLIVRMGEWIYYLGSKLCEENIETDQNEICFKYKTKHKEIKVSESKFTSTKNQKLNRCESYAETTMKTKVLATQRSTPESSIKKSSLSDEELNKEYSTDTTAFDPYSNQRDEYTNRTHEYSFYRKSRKS